MGFRSTGAFPHCQVPLGLIAQQDCPHGVCSSVPHLGLALPRHLRIEPDVPQAYFCASRAFLQQWIRTISSTCLGRHQTADPLLSFFLSRVSPNTQRQHPRAMPSAHVLLPNCLSSVLQRLRLQRTNDHSQLSCTPACSPPGAVSRSLNRNIPF
jgi:hypothetical protein